MNQPVNQELVRGWIAEFVARDKKPSAPGGKAYRELNRLCEKEPELALDTIQAIGEQTDALEVLSVLAAGPLENLLVEHGPKLVEDVISRASSSPKFRELLGGMWSGRISQDVWERLERGVAVRQG